MILLKKYLTQPAYIFIQFFFKSHFPTIRFLLHQPRTRHIIHGKLYILESRM